MPASDVDPLRAAAATAVAAAFATLVAPWGCTDRLPAPIAAEQGAGEPRRGGTLRFASMNDIRTLDPAATSDGLTIDFVHLLFAGLVDLDRHGQVVPDLAERWEVTDGGRTYRFFLRSAVTMHDGAELTADDVKRSVERALHPTTPNPNASYFHSLAGYDAYAAGRSPHLDGVDVEGRYVVAFHLEEPDATFLPLLTGHSLRPTCKSAGDRYSDSWHPCGAGPFELPPDGWKRGTSVRLVRHDAYYRAGLPYLDAVEWTFNMAQLSERFRFEAGDLDVLRDLTQADQVRYASDARWAPLTTRDGDTRIYGESMNTRVPPFDNVEIRRAVASAIDREHVRLLKPAYITVVDQLVPPDIPGYDPSITGTRYDLAAALEHMRKAGYAYDPATGRGGWPQPIVYPVYDRGLLVYTAQLVQQDLAKIGLRIELRMVSWQAFLTLRQRPSGAAMSQGNWEMDYPDPSSFFEPLFTTGALPPAGSNSSFYSNPRFDDLVERARHELDPGHRRKLYHAASDILRDDAPWAFAYSYHFFYVRQPYVRDFALHPIWSVGDLTTTWVDRPPSRAAALFGRPQ
jgi:ABC-type transport system substrate-binding protein